MSRNTIIGIVVVVVVVILGVWWWSSMSATPAAPAVSETPTGTATGVPPTGGTAILTLNTATDSKLGTLLVAPNGMTLYRFTKDGNNSSTCYGQCAAIWPPYTVASGTPLAGGASVGGTIGTITRKDGSVQITYNGKPLYYYANDKNPGDTTGQNVMGVWFVVKP